LYRQETRIVENEFRFRFLLGKVESLIAQFLS